MLQKQVKALNERVDSLTNSLQQNEVSEKQLQEAIQAAAEAANDSESIPQEQKTPYDEQKVAEKPKRSSAAASPEVTKKTTSSASQKNATKLR